jgi:hypothetical protein
MSANTTVARVILMHMAIGSQFLDLNHQNLSIPGPNARPER